MIIKVQKVHRVIKSVVKIPIYKKKEKKKMVLELSNKISPTHLSQESGRGCGLQTDI